MLYPQSNSHRQCIELPDLWDFAFDPQDKGVHNGWQNGLTESRPIAVPASWNDQFEDGRDYLDAAWYQTDFVLPWGWDTRHIFLRFGSVNYLASVWLNGSFLGEHEGGHLPFEFNVTALVKPGTNRLIVRVDGALAPDRVPPGNVTGDSKDFFDSHAGNYPQSQFDFFPFCGIQRPVWIYATAPTSLRDITVITEIEGESGLVKVTAQTSGTPNSRLRLQLSGHEFNQSIEIACKENDAEGLITVPTAAFWSPTSPSLYTLRVEVVESGQVVDVYSLPVGIRTIQVEGSQLLLNGQPVYLTGFGRHEDFPVVGRGYLPALIIKDYALMQWVGANSFRTSHYPYSEPMMDLADRLGILVIDETPAVGLFFREDGLEKRQDLCRQYVRELIARDKNHPSVIMWSLANEPHSQPPRAKPFFHDLYETAKNMDATRPVTLVSFMGAAEESFEFCDVLCLNRYMGWYSQPGDLESGLARLSRELDALHQQYSKPLILSEFGADAIAGHHAQPPEMFSEEYQAEMVERYIQLLRQKPFVIGEHVWNLCDFKTSQGVTRAGALNHKGVFTRDRRPKLAAHRLRRLWSHS